jgi:hypothetical protein
MKIQSENNHRVYEGMPLPSASITSIDNVGVSETARTVKIPDIFESFMSRLPAINPLYEPVRVQALDWASK